MLLYSNSIQGPGSQSEEGPEWRSGKSPAGPADASCGARGLSPGTGHGGELLIVCFWTYWLFEGG